jgi:enoyl-CoA hydratase/carnithine racemase/pimeloyl-ACP methyl ester carboxylesterase
LSASLLHYFNITMSKLLIERHGHVLSLTLNRPDQGNVIDAELMQALSDALRIIPENIACITLSGLGLDFCQGRENAPPPSLPPGPAMVKRMAIRKFGIDPILELYARLREAPVPVITFVQGLAGGMGCALAGACDLVIAADTARFEAAELEKQFAPTLLINALWDRVPSGSLMQMVLSMKPVDATKARSFGLVNEVVAEKDLDSVKQRFTALMNSRSPQALRAIKSMMLQAKAAGGNAGVRSDAAGSLLAENFLALMSDLPAPLSLQREVVDLGNERIAYTDQGKGDPLVLIHSLGLSAQLWSDVMPLLAQGRRVIAIEARGHGKSSMNGGFHVDTIADDVIALSNQLNLGRFDLLGISMGGLIGITVAARQGSNVRSLVLSGAYACVAGPVAEERLALLGKLANSVTLSAIARNYLEQTLLRHVPHATRERLACEIAAMKTDNYVKAATHVARHDVTGLLPSLKLPVLVLNGDKDANVPSIISALLSQRIAGAVTRVVSGAGHLACVDQPQAYAQEVLSFLSQRP